MAPEGANVVIFEDNISVLETTKEVLEDCGHNVVGTGTSMEEAIKEIDKLEKKKVDVVVTDGNLSEDDASGNDGLEIVKRIKEKYPHIVVIGRSGSGAVEGADKNCPKGGGSFKLAEMITES